MHAPSFCARKKFDRNFFPHRGWILTTLSLGVGWGALLVLPGCAKEGVTFQVDVNRQVDLNAIKSVAVLEFDWHVAGAAAKTAPPANPSPLPPPPKKNKPRPAPKAVQDDEEESDDEEPDAEDSKEVESGDDNVEEPEEPEAPDDDDSSDDEVRVRPGATVADQVASALIGLGRYAVRERSKLAKVLEEHDLAAADIIAGRQYAVMGGLLNVDALVIGEVDSFGRKFGSSHISFSCRCIDARTGDVVWTVSGEKAQFGGETLINASRALVRAVIGQLGAELEGRSPSRSAQTGARESASTP